ncbi:MAG: hypothetical protein K6G69_08290 [Lachnospiraceae bacterium]|nr:hypothetical protein [Lachnospiraceae bacterium]
MQKNMKISYGKPYPMGATVVGEDTVNFAVVMSTDETCGVIIYNRKKKTSEKLSFCCSNKVGNVRCMKVSGIDLMNCEYNFYIGDKIINDPYSKQVLGNDRWGKLPDRLRSGFYSDNYDWEDDAHPLIPFNRSIFYCLHVRGFTRHSSSKVHYPGTFEGIVEKIDYLKELGVTAIEMMPAYNFVEYAPKEEPKDEFAIGPYEPEEIKLNYWGYKDSFYFAPKGSFAAKGKRADISFKDMVKALHKAGIEVIMQFYFPSNIKQGYIFEVLKFWMQEYHVDGFHLMGEVLLSLLGTEPMLANTKIMCDHVPVDDIYERGTVPDYKNLALCNDKYMYDMRRFIKSDEGMIPAVLNYMKHVPAKIGDVHFFSHGNTFTLMDTVSYDRKHNEDNGENNRDGSPYNGSWNCGFEGPTNKKSVRTLRNKQIRNAIILNMLSRSTPLIVAGDEFGRSQKGNNNPYCHDNAVTWVNWKDLEKNRDIYDFMRYMIDMRKRFSILHGPESFKMNDYLECGYPDLSFHGEEPWVVDADPLSRQFGMLYDGNYAGDDVFIYVAVNMHWSAHDFAIPEIPSKYSWEILVNTDKSGFVTIKKDDMSRISVKERSIVIMLGKKNELLGTS